MTGQETARLNTLWGRLLAEELARCGVRHVCISPGSRSTPLAAAVARSARLEGTLWLDERGAAFHALGIARATGMPAAVVCTSGTAVANLLPAVVEASQDCVPLLLLTADRPPELRECGANQAIRQPGIFGDQVRWFFELPVPDAAITARMPLTTVDQAVHRALGPPAGPVHLNCLFREPLEPVAECGWPEELPGRWVAGDGPLTAYSRPVAVPAPGETAEIARLVRGASRGLLLVGELPGEADRDAARRLARHLGWPLVADVRSGLRLGGAPDSLVPHIDQLLLAEEVREDFAPDVLLHLGGQPVSKRLAQALAARPPAARVAVKEHPFRHDPEHRLTHRVEASVARFCEALLGEPPGDGGAWRAGLQAASTIAGEVLDRFVAEEPLGEIAVARLVSREIPPGHGLALASSMPVRDMDMFGDVVGPPVRVASNRGASGIDGTVATAAGFACGLGRPATLVTGDLSLLHDLTALLHLGRLAQPLVIVLLNNGGGGIFHFLPIAAHADLLDPWFTAPHAADFSGVEPLFGIPCHRPAGAGAFVETYRRACGSGRPALIEVRTDRAHNLAAHRALGEAVAAAVRLRWRR
jgi:2-succinyl-5-enolpyruvyl-6-hydroxy-3-cyclohexene-1-carboxylate synthase